MSDKVECPECKNTWNYKGDNTRIKCYKCKKYFKNPLKQYTDKKTIQNLQIPFNMKPIGTPHSLLARKILKAHKTTGYAGAIIYGPRGIGKTSYALKTLYDLYHNGYGIDETKAYDIALNQTLFDLPEVTQRIKENLEHDRPTQALILDDSGTYLSGISYGVRYNYHVLMKGFFDTIRMATSSILFTTPNINDLVSYVKRNDDLTIHITKRSEDYRRTAVIYSQYTLPSGMNRIKKVGETEYSCWLPESVYKKYCIKRKEMQLNIANEMDKRIKIQEARDQIMFNETQPRTL